MIVAENIRKEFSSSVVLESVSLHVRPGQVYGLVGKNGAGKTTLLNILSGISEASQGVAYINGKPVGKNTLGRGVVGYLPDLPSFFDYLTVKEYLVFLAKGGKNQNRQYNIDAELDRVRLDSKCRIKALSRGNRQKLGILSAVINHPPVVLLDEPTSALDPIGRHEVMDLICSLKRDGAAVILSTHILSDLEYVCDTIGFLHKGKIAHQIEMGEKGTANICTVTLAHLLTNETRSKLGFIFSEDNLVLRVDLKTSGGRERVLQSLAPISDNIEQIVFGAPLDLEKTMQEVLSK